MPISKCGACGNVFRSVYAFDLHRVGSFGDAIYRDGDGKKKSPVGYTKPSRRCLSEEEMLEKGMSQNDQGQWISSVYDPNIRHAEDADEVTA